MKPVRIICGSPGTGSDLLTRQLGQRLNERWQRGVVVDNRGGANAIIGADMAAKAPPDGYTLLMGQIASHAAAPSLYKRLPYDPIRDFAPITLAAQEPLVLIAHPSVPATNLGAFIDYVKTHPGMVSYSAGSHGTGSNLTMVLFKITGGLDLHYIPYKGNAAALTAILTREAQVAFNPISIALPLLGSGRVKAYAITARKRFAGAPEIPTLDEARMPGFESTVWFGMFGPPRVPAKLIDRLNRDIVEVLRTPEMQTVLLAHGMDAVPSTPEAFGMFLRNEIVKWGKVIKAAGIEPE